MPHKKYNYLGNLILAAGSAALGMETYLINGIRPFPIYIAFLFTSTFFLYNLFRNYDTPTAGRIFRLKLAVFDIFLLSMSISLLFFSGPLLMVCTAGLGLSALAYRFYFRRFPLLKIMVISLIWALLTKVLPALGHLDMALMFQAFNTAVFIAALVLIFEIADSETDLKEGNTNLYHLLGKKRTVLYSLGLVALCILTLSVLFVREYSRGAAHACYYLGLIIFYFCSLFWIYFSSYNTRSKEWLMLTVDIMLFLRALLVMIVYYFFLS